MFLDKYFKQETEIMYYVYQLVDPRNNQPFYIGKGKGRRANTHLWQIPETRNVYKENKIASIRKDGLEPEIEYIAENIIDESLAYTIESALIKKYGRKGYEKNGILTNVCPDNRPPNHKGKTYKEIYGQNWQNEILKRISTKEKNNNYGGVKKHTDKTKEQIKNSVIRAHSLRDCSHFQETKDKIGKANREYSGKLNKKSYAYKLTSPDCKEYILYGGDAATFCKEKNLSWSTLKMQIQKRWPVPKKGKTKGWKLEIIQKGFGL
jgi:hypothetical protein